jgi:FtsP/CotA-like multicopper oxidase with cupredoxin domain
MDWASGKFATSEGLMFMRTPDRMILSRRTFLGGTAGSALLAALPGRSAQGVTKGAAHDYRLALDTASAPLVGGTYPETDIWAYNGTVPGPEIRVPQGSRLRVAVENKLAEATTVHWHGIRLPNAMDGVPFLTQTPIEPGDSFVYEFDVPDAGSYWYHPHQRSFEQVGRGLYGPLIVEERSPIQVDRDATWVLDDWRLQPNGQISGDFGDFRDIAHGGRIGNTVTVNGRVPDTFAVRQGERLRLRLINAANARIFGLDFAGHHPMVIAIDGQPVEPHAPAVGLVVVAPAMRIDLVLDFMDQPGQRSAVADRFYERGAYHLLDLVYEPEPLRQAPLITPIALPSNTMPEPDLAAAETHAITFDGGMMGGLISAMMDHQRVSPQEMMRNNMAWSVNGVVATGHTMEPMLSLRRGQSTILALNNETAWHHPIHLHGHSFRVISRNGRPTAHREWQDTVLMAPRDKVEIAFVADNPGGWMFHCHILEHQAGGMSGVIHVA